MEDEISGEAQSAYYLELNKAQKFKLDSFITRIAIGLSIFETHW